MTPLRLRNYLELTRLHKFPLGTALTFWPAAFGVTMAAYAFNIPAREFARQSLAFGIGCTLLHCTFCVLNDIFDRDLDAFVERTKGRPMVTGTVTLPGAWSLFIGSLLATSCPLFFANEQAFTIGLLSLPLHVLYPLAKRWTWWPQVWLGIVLGWSFFVGWFSVAADKSSRDQMLAVFYMYGAIICWTIHFDTVYATQDREDDARIGVLSTARLFGAWLRELDACFAISTVMLVACAGYLNKQGVAYYVLSCGGAACHLAWQLTRWDPDRDESNKVVFKSNSELGLIMFSGMAVDYIFNSLPST
ncbi:UbiA prenyltransferase [Peniophora sp. CONT]|nr:UbiA prenyltransferase [Peniophora sp. CONT]